MVGEELAKLVRYRTRTNSTTFPDADIVLLGNSLLETMARGIMGTDEDTLVLPHTTDLRLNIREYPFPESILSRIKYVEAKLDGDKWLHLEEFDLQGYQQPTDETNILANFSNDEGRAKYDISRKSLWLYCGPIIEVVGGLKLWCNTYPAKLAVDKLHDILTDLSEDPTPTTHGFPQELHELWARGIVIEYKSSREKPIPLNEQELSWRVDYLTAIQDLKRGNVDREVLASVPSGDSRWHNGQDI